MTRDFKFRIWDTQAKILYHSKNSKTPKTRLRQLHLYFIDFLMGLDDYCNKFLKIMQYTGLKDSSGKEIYEGDIMDFNYDLYPDDSKCPYVVIFEDGCFRRSRKDWPADMSKPLLTKHELSILKDQVIGNIYENPEVLDNTELTNSLDQLTEETFFEEKEDSKAYPLLLYYTVLDGTNISTPDCPFIGRTGQHGIVKKVSIGSQYCVNKCPYKCNHFPKDKEIWCMFKERQVGEPGEK